MSDTSSAGPKKRLALFLDGTWNVVSDNTNVWRLRSLFAPVGADGCEQCTYYSTGLGTKFGEKVRGGMFGSGIDTAITSAYEWLIENYESDDEIFIFGFSRGAYTARSLSWIYFQVRVASARRAAWRQSTLQTIPSLRRADHSGIDCRTKGQNRESYLRRRLDAEIRPN